MVSYIRQKDDDTCRDYLLNKQSKNQLNACGVNYKVFIPMYEPLEVACMHVYGYIVTGSLILGVMTIFITTMVFVAFILSYLLPRIRSESSEKE